MDSPEPSNVVQSKIAHDRPEDTFRIMLATDNHIGYLERDPIRGQDSINTFREILQLAVKHEVDMIVLSGDLFHENRPSRDVLYEVVALLREYTMGSKPVEFELLSDPLDGQADGFTFPAINSEDANLNVGIPVFSIHGNHDDPQGTGPVGALCALDLLSVTGLMNYIGKSDLPHSDETAHTDGLLVKPVLLRKGESHLAIYGIGNVKDTRMHYELRSNRVRMYMPDDDRNWFNLLLIHQNRVKHGPQESVPESMFDERVNLVVWGHEHDCRITPEPVAGREYMITQPGSSVATSLAEGEALPKHVALLEVLDGSYELTPIELRTVRPFVLDTVYLVDELEKEGIELTDQAAINKLLRKKAIAMIAKANKEREQKSKLAVKRGEEPLEPMLPLIRLKVDTTRVPGMTNPIRFGQEFQGKVANPKDMLVFSRARQVNRNKTVADAPDLDNLIDPDLPSAEKFAQIRVSALVNEYLKAQNLDVLAENGMSNAVMTYVDKDDTHAIQEFVDKSLKKMLKGATKTAGPQVDESGIEEELMRLKEQQEKEFEKEREEEDEEDEEEEAAARQPKPKAKATNGKGKARAARDEESDDSMMVDDDDFVDRDVPKKSAAAASKGKAPAKAAPAAKQAQGTKKAKMASMTKLFADSDEEMDEPEDGDDYQEEEEEEPVKPKTKKAASSRAAVLSAPAKKTPARKKAPAASQAKTQSTLSFAPTQQRASRAAATRAKAKIQDDAIEISSDE